MWWLSTILSETIRIGVIDKRDNLPFQALDNISGEYYGYYIDLATTIAEMAGFDHKLIINSSQYADLGQFSASSPSPFSSEWNILIGRDRRNSVLPLVELYYT